MAVSYLELLDWRRRMAELFVELRHRPADAETLDWFRGQKDALFRDHPQSPLPEPDRAAFTGLPYWPFDPQARVTAHFTPLPPRPEDEHPEPSHSEPSHSELSHSELSHPGPSTEVDFTPIGHLEFQLHDQPLTLGAFWIAGYAGGLFVPFIDATSGHQTYGGGRYLLDTIKSADFGSDAAASRVVLDFNYAYHPSCAYDPRWVCPLAPPDSRLAVPIRAGEQSR